MNAEVLDFFNAAIGIGMELNPCNHLLAVKLAGYAKYCNACNLWMSEDKILDFARIDIFAAPYNHLLEAAGNPEISVFVHHARIT
jgi:hypothetical protein